MLLGRCRAVYAHLRAVSAADPGARCAAALPVLPCCAYLPFSGDLSALYFCRMILRLHCVRLNLGRPATAKRNPARLLHGGLLLAAVEVRPAALYTGVYSLRAYILYVRITEEGVTIRAYTSERASAGQGASHSRCHSRRVAKSKVAESLASERKSQGLFARVASVSGRAAPPAWGSRCQSRKASPRKSLNLRGRFQGCCCLCGKVAGFFSGSRYQSCGRSVLFFGVDDGRSAAFDIV